MTIQDGEQKLSNNKENVWPSIHGFKLKILIGHIMKNITEIGPNFTSQWRTLYALMGKKCIWTKWTPHRNN